VCVGGCVGVQVFLCYKMNDINNVETL